MDDIIFEVLLELSMMASANKKISLWIRIPAIIILILFVLLYGFILLGIAGVSYSALLRQEYLISVLMLGLEILLVIGVVKYIQQFLRYKRENEKQLNSI